VNFGSIIGVDLTRVGEQEFQVAQSDRLWLPKTVIQGTVVITNPMDAVLAIRVNKRSSAALPWAIQDGYMNSLSGAFDVLYITVLQKGAGSVLYLNTGVGASAQYASSDGLSPIVGGGAQPSRVVPAD
jgi:hypothetical protein